MEQQKQKLKFMTEDEIKQATMRARVEMQRMTYDQQNEAFAKFIIKHKKERK